MGQYDSWDYLTNFIKENPDSFDVILFNDVIEHLTKDECIDMLLCMKDALRKGGVVITKTVNCSNPFTFGSGRYIDFTHELGFTEMSLKQLFNALEYSSINVYGCKIYIKNNPIFWAAALAEKIVSLFIYLLHCLYGRFSIKIFTKNLLAVARK